MGQQRSIDWFVRKPEAKRPLGSCRRGRENNIKMVLQDVGLTLFHVFQETNRLCSVVILRSVHKAGRFLDNRGNISFYRGL